MSLILPFLPIILIIICGYALIVTGILPEKHWSGIETLSFRLLIPAILVKSIATSTFSFEEFGPLTIIILLTLTIVGLVVLSLRWLFSKEYLQNPSFTTLFQTATRWNAFISLAAAEQYLGPEGLALLAILMAFTIPFINVSNIVVLAVFGSGPVSYVNITKTLIKNPLIQGCAIGIFINLSGISLHETVLQTLEIISRAALGVALLTIGAGINLRRLLKSSSLVWMGVILRLVLCPGIFIGLSVIFRLDPSQLLAGILALAVPAATNGYIVAKQLGGDAELYADILVWQTILSILLLPAFVMLLGSP